MLNKIPTRWSGDLNEIALPSVIAVLVVGLRLPAVIFSEPEAVWLLVRDSAIVFVAYAIFRVYLFPGWCAHRALELATKSEYEGASAFLLRSRPKWKRERISFHKARALIIEHRQGNLAAIKYLKEVEQLLSDNPDALIYMAQLSLRAGDRDTAVDYVKKYEAIVATMRWRNKLWLAGPGIRKAYEAISKQLNQANEGPKVAGDESI